MLGTALSISMAEGDAVEERMGTVIASEIQNNAVLLVK